MVYETKYFRVLGKRLVGRLAAAAIISLLALMVLGDVVAFMLALIPTFLAVFGSLETPSPSVQPSYELAEHRGVKAESLKFWYGLLRLALTEFFLVVAGLILFGGFTAAMGSCWLPYFAVWNLVFVAALRLSARKPGYQAEEGLEIYRLGVDLLMMILSVLLIIGVFDSVWQIVLRRPSFFPAPQFPATLLLGLITPLVVVLVRTLLTGYYSSGAPTEQALSRHSELDSESGSRNKFGMTMDGAATGSAVVIRRKTIGKFSCKFPDSPRATGFDHAFDVEDGTGKFLGEVGVGLTEKPENKAEYPFAFDVWLHDGKDVVTYTKTVITPGAAKLGWLQAIPNSQDVSLEPEMQFNEPVGWGVDVTCRFMTHAGNGNESFETAEFTFTVWQLSG